MKRIVVLFLAAMLMLSSAVAEGTFRVGLECNYAPFNWTQADENEFTVPIEGGGGYADGYDVQIARKIAEGLGKEFVIVHAGLMNFSPERPLDDYEIYELIFMAPDYESVYFTDRYLVTGHLPTKAIHINPRPNKIFIKNNHISIDCGSGYDGTVGCICLDTFKEFYA